MSLVICNHLFIACRLGEPFEIFSILTDDATDHGVRSWSTDSNVKFGHLGLASYCTG